jgi:catechol 2,3-dioxygenase-like lactoylglutathione lyase family enzyme
MGIGCSQILLQVADLSEARSFYVEKLGLEVIEEFPKMVAVRAGDLRFSIFAGGKRRYPSDEDQYATVMFRTADLASTMNDWFSRGVEFDGEVEVAPNFMRYVSFRDPDGNQHYLAEYLTDPLVKNA